MAAAPPVVVDGGIAVTLAVTEDEKVVEGFHVTVVTVLLIVTVKILGS